MKLPPPDEATVKEFHQFLHVVDNVRILSLSAIVLVLCPQSEQMEDLIAGALAGSIAEANRLGQKFQDQPLNNSTR